MIGILQGGQIMPLINIKALKGGELLTHTEVLRHPLSGRAALPLRFRRILPRMPHCLKPPFEGQKETSKRRKWLFTTYISIIFRQLIWSDET
jgi:hypothetical protein